MAKKYDFTDYSMDTTLEKASPVLEHEYRPVKDDQDIIVRCEHFTAGEKMKYAAVRTDGTFYFDYARIFADKTTSIEGLTLTFRDAKTGKATDVKITDPYVLVGMPDKGIVSEIVRETALHLINGESLTEKEEKNSD